MASTLHVTGSLCKSVVTLRVVIGLSVFGWQGEASAACHGRKQKILVHLSYGTASSFGAL